MSAAELREAAALMRERAEAVAAEHYIEQTLLRGVVRCTCGASSVGDPDWARTHVAELSWQQSRDEATQVWDERERLVASAEGSDEAAHIASWHPAVALAVADWLEVVACRWLEAGERSSVTRERASALAVARAYLGSAQ